MHTGKIRLFVLSLSFLAVLLLCFFIPKDYNEWYLSASVIVLAVVVYFFVKKKSIPNINRRTVLLLLFVIALLYLVLYYLLGFVFGYTRYSAYTFSALIKKIVPIVTVTVGIEFVRHAMISQNNKLSSAVTFIFCVVAYATLEYNFYSFRNFNKFMDFVGLCLFPTVTYNLLFTYLSKRFGILPIVTYRLLVVIIPLFIVYKPAVSDALNAFINLIFPIAIYLFINLLFEKKKREKPRVSKKVGVVLTSVLLVFMTAVIMVVSCQFRIRAVVIATESMTGELNKGDVVVYERYDEQILQVNQIIVFEKYGAKTVHRIIKIEIVDGQSRYFTKGDYNEDPDSGYITDVDVEGIVHFKLAYVGYPTLWLRSIFN